MCGFESKRFHYFLRRDVKGKLQSIINKNGFFTFIAKIGSIQHIIEVKTSLGGFSLYCIGLLNENEASRFLSSNAKKCISLFAAMLEIR